jgi:hypothetical protein
MAAIPKRLFLFMSILLFTGDRTHRRPMHSPVSAPYTQSRARRSSGNEDPL